MKNTILHFFRRIFFVSVVLLFSINNLVALNGLPLVSSDEGISIHNFTTENKDAVSIPLKFHPNNNPLLFIESPSLSVTINNHCDIDCYGGNNAHVKATVEGGTAPYTFLWNNGATTSELTDITAGTYSVIVQDANSSTANAQIIINQPSKLHYEIIKLNDASAFGASDGSAKITASGGTYPYTYLWDNGETNATATNLNAGTHYVTITDKNECTIKCHVIIDEPAPPIEEICDGIDNDDDGDIDEGFADTDNDGISDCVDDCDDNIDSDNDGISDCVDDCDDNIDSDNDGISDCVDDCDDNIDSDNDGISDCEDDCDDNIDSDNDGISDCEDDCDDNIDSDNDGISDCVDDCDDNIDSDNDGISDCMDDCDDNIDSDNDGISDCVDDCDDNIDSDNDGISDCEDDCDDNIDSDNDGISDCEDDCDDTIDSDNDGISDCVDDCDDNIDSDNDGISDCEDDCDDNIDSDNDGISDCVDDCDDTIDSDNDGISDCEDDCDDTIDSDNDGISDCVDDCDDTIDSDNDGISDCEDDCDDNIDSDNDGISDCEDDCDDTIDSDNDGISDCEDDCDDNIDSDNDGISDCVDDCDDTIDSDNDGVSDCEDICEGGDDNIDSDNDGIPDFCDDVDPPSGCETAFARYSPANTCFIDDGFNRWGWTNYFSSAGVYNLELYAGAGQCNYQNKGTQSGNVTVNWADNNMVTVTINLLSGFVMQEAHLYIGSNDYPEKQLGRWNTVETVAPGSYPYNSGALNNLTTYQFSPVDVSTFDDNGIYVIVHAVTCRSLSTKKSTTVKAYPTIFDNELNLDIEVTKNTKGAISMHGMNGIIVREFPNIKLAPGNNQIKINTSELSGSMYFLVIRTSDGNKIVKKVIARK